MPPQVLRLPALLAALAMLCGLVAPASAAGTNPLDSTGVLLPAGAPAPPPVPATAWLVADADSGEVLAAQAPGTPLAPASTLKLLTALALAPELDRQQTWTAVHEDAAIDGSKVGLVPGSVYRVEDLLHGLLLGSGNDTANALAGLVGGMDAATARMQEVAAGLGATDTVVRNTSGLDAEGQVSTVVDLALIGQAVLADPALAQLVRTTRYQFPGEGTTFGPERPTFEIANHNRLLYGYDGAIGLKNGYTVAAGGSFVGAVERDGRRYLVSLLNTEGSTSEQARVLLDWAVAHGPAVEPVATLPAPQPQHAAALDRDRDQASRGDREQSPAQQPEGGAANAAAEPRQPGDSGLPGWVTVTATVLLLLAGALAALRARVLLRRRARRRAQQRRRAPAVPLRRRAEVRPAPRPAQAPRPGPAPRPQPGEPRPSEGRRSGPAPTTRPGDRGQLRRRA